MKHGPQERVQTNKDDLGLEAAFGRLSKMDIRDAAVVEQFQELAELVTLQDKGVRLNYWAKFAALGFAGWRRRS